MMIILMTAALAAAQPVPAPAGNEMPQHMAMGEARQHEQMKCCDCCKDMAEKHEGHARHDGHTGK
jgi:hypothetical protein